MTCKGCVYCVIKDDQAACLVNAHFVAKMSRKKIKEMSPAASNCTLKQVVKNKVAGPQRLLIEVAMMQPNTRKADWA